MATPKKSINTKKYVKRAPLTKAELTHPKDQVKDYPMSKQGQKNYESMLRSRAQYVPKKKAVTKKRGK